MSDIIQGPWLYLVRKSIYSAPLIWRPREPPLVTLWLFSRREPAKIRPQVSTLVVKSTVYSIFSAYNPVVTVNEQNCIDF